MRVKLICFIFCIVYSSFLFGQGAVTTTSSAEKFNRRGYYKNDAVSKNNNEVISDFDGNLMLNYSTPVELPYDLGADFTINYNPNVEHRVYCPLMNNTSGGNIYYYNMGIAINSAEWIMGYKGFALQTLNFENYQNADMTITKPEYVKREVPMLIPGYHYGNFHGYMGVGMPEWGAVTRDYIMIMRADGSKMTLRNTETEGSYTGIYVEEGNETKGFAVVTFNSADSNPVLAKRRRIIEYRPGDGLVYKFDEQTSHIEDDSTTRKKTIYLTKVSNPAYRDANGVAPSVNFGYATSVDVMGVPFNIHGRMVFSSMTYNSNIASLGKISMEYNYYTSLNTFSSIKIKNQATGQSINLDTYSLYFRNALSNLRVAVKGKTLFPTKVQFLQEASTTVLREDLINYFLSSGRPTQTRQYSYNNSGVSFYYKDSTYIPQSVVYYNGQKSEFEFYPKRFDGITNYYLELSTGEQSCSANMDTALRDCFTNYMIKWRKIYNTSNLLTRQEDYSYSIGTPRSYLVKGSANQDTTIIVADLVTSLLVSDKLSGATGTKTIAKTFNYFNTSFKNYSANFDSYKTSKLVEENISSNIYGTPAVKKVYLYDFGQYISYTGVSGQNYFQGSFALKSIKETETKNSVSAVSLKSINYSNVSVCFGSTNFKKFVTASETSKDTSTLYNYKQYKNLINCTGTSVTYTTAAANYPDYYKIGLPLADKTYGKATPSSSELVLKHTTYTYSTATTTLGDEIEIKDLLHTVVNNNQASTRLATSTFLYCILTPTSTSLLQTLIVRAPPGGTNNYYPGMLRYSLSPKGVSERLYYPSSGVPPIYSKVVSTTGTSYDYYTGPGARHFKPWKRDITADYSNFALYTRYSDFGMPEYEVDVNNYYSGFSYDIFQRIKIAAFPGCFDASNLDGDNPLNTPGTIPSITYTYYDSTNKIAGTSQMDFASSKTFQFEDQYDALGNFTYKKEKNDSGTLEQLFNKTYNGFGLVKAEDIYAVGTTQKVTKTYTYDGLDRILTSTAGNATQNFAYDIASGSFTRNSYTVNYVRRNTVTDAESKTVITYFDQVGKKVAEKIGSNDPTLFVYNEAYQLTRVITPEGKETVYTYDSLGYLSSKTSADEGTYNYKYSKYGELRYQFHTTQTPATLLYHNYDKLGRLQVTGTRTTSQTLFNALNPDVNATEDNTAANMTLVNVYDFITLIGSSYYSAVFSGFSLPAGVTLANTNGKLALTAYRDNTSGAWSYKAYSYDYAGRVTNVYVKDAVSATPVWKTITNSYDHMENLTQQTVDNTLFRYRYEYDNRARLKKVYTKASTKTTEINDAEYVYNIASQITQQKLPAMPNNTDAVNYTYDYLLASPKGWLTTINSTNPANSTVRFNEGLTYYLNGNVNTQALTNLGNGAWTPYTYTFGYDAMNRISTAANSNAAYAETYTYNQDGGIATKVRNGTTRSYAYVTGTHKIQNVTGSTNFVYDYKGNVTSDPFSSVTLTSFDFRNLPTAITTGGVNYTYKYNDGGQRIYKEGSTTKDYYLLDHTGRALLIYDMNTGNLKSANIYGSGMIGRVDITGGATGSGTERLYYVKDHLGSIRLTLSSTNTANNNIIFASDYYPFGETLREYTTGTNKYKFTEKERDAESGYDYFGARYYNNRLGVWLSVDPLAHKMPGWNPYCYTYNNPIIFIDIKGLIPFPLLASWNGLLRKSENNFGVSRDNGSRVHKGVDWNYVGRGGSADKGSPIVATHTGIVSKIIGVGDSKNGGGNRIEITSHNGRVKTYYMHLDNKPEYQPGDKISEGQSIGQMGGSGKGKDDAYTPHLHYELWIDGKPVNSMGKDGKPIDPQKVIDEMDKKNEKKDGKGNNI